MADSLSCCVRPYRYTCTPSRLSSHLTHVKCGVGGEGGQSRPGLYVHSAMAHHARTGSNVSERSAGRGQHPRVAEDIHLATLLPAPKPVELPPRPWSWRSCGTKTLCDDCAPSTAPAGPPQCSLSTSTSTTGSTSTAAPTRITRRAPVPRRLRGLRLRVRERNIGAVAVASSRR